MKDFWNLWPEVIFGREGEDGADDNEGDNEDEDSDDENSDDDANDGDNADKESDKSKDDIAELQKALAAERRVTKKLERDNRRLTASKESKDAEKDETLEESQQREQAATARAEKLAAGLLKRDIDSAIKEAARDLKFLDTEDALNLVDRSKIVADQDDEDPTDIDIDLDSVKAAVKALAAKKPHFLNKGTDDGDATGSQFGGSRKSKKPTEDSFKELYPSL